MKNLCIVVFLFLILPFGCKTSSEQVSTEIDAPTAISEQEIPEISYIIGPGDALKISVWRHADLQSEVKVQPDGKISFPIVHTVKAFGLTPAELEKTLADGLRKMIRDPDVTVNVTYFASQKIIVLGEVYKPGVYPFPGNVYISEAIAYAGGHLDSAFMSSVLLIRQGTAKRVNVTRALRWADIKENVPLQSGDIIFVPKSFIAEINKFVDQFFTKTDPVLKYYLDILDIDKHGESTRTR